MNNSCSNDAFLVVGGEPETAWTSSEDDTFTDLTDAMNELYYPWLC